MTLTPSWWLSALVPRVDWLLRILTHPGVVYAVDYLTASTVSVLDGGEPAVNARGLDVVVIGGGDTGNDCVGTAVRQGARSVRQFEFLPAAPDARAASNPWPQWPNVKKTDYGQQEAIAAMGGEMRAWGVDTLEVLLDKKGAAAGLRVVDLDWSAGKPERIAGSEHEVPAQLVLIACGFTGPEHGVFDAVGVPVATAGRPLPVMAAEGSHLAARVDGVAADAAPVYVAGDARNGSSLVVKRHGRRPGLRCRSRRGAGAVRRLFTVESSRAVPNGRPIRNVPKCRHTGDVPYVSAFGDTPCGFATDLFVCRRTSVHLSTSWAVATCCFCGGCGRIWLEKGGLAVYACLRFCCGAHFRSSFPSSVWSAVWFAAGGLFCPRWSWLPTLPVSSN